MTRAPFFWRSPGEPESARAIYRLAALVLACAACPGTATRLPDAAPQASAPDPLEIAESIYDGGLKDGWQASGSAPRELDAHGATKVRFGNSNEWILTRPGLAGQYGAIAFRVKEPVGEGEFLEVRLGSADGRAFRAVKVKPDHRTEIGDGWTQVLISMVDLNPEGAAFDRIVFLPFRPFGDEWVLFDRIGLAKASSSYPPSGGAASAARIQGTPMRAKIACDAKATKISALIYGIAASDEGWEKLGATARRWGGNPTTRYNWETNFWNKASDWFFENAPAPRYGDFLAGSAAHEAMSALTIPIIGWVAKDATSSGFPVSAFGPQSQTDPWRGDAGNGMSKAGAKIPPGPPTQTSVVAPPEWAKRWVSTIRAEDAKAGKRSVYEYILDNEPMLWSTTHRDVHPDPLGYDELLDRTVQYGTAIRQADPDAVIAGPAEWGWANYFNSAKDLSGKIHTDRLTHFNVPLIEWYLRKLHDHERRTGTRILDVLDVHYYPQEANVYSGGGVDEATRLLRLRSTRSLWDPSYVDESWINEPIRLLPRMKEWVDGNYPGRGISIGEWSFGAEKDVSGALATAETLGRFAQFGVTSAFYWGAPAAGSASSFGFLAYRNFDGKGGRFLDQYVPSTSTNGISVFASRDADGKHLVVVVINTTPESSVTADLDLVTCGAVASHQAFVYSGGAGFEASAASSTGEIQQGLMPWSMAVIDIHLR